VKESELSTKRSLKMKEWELFTNKVTSCSLLCLGYELLGFCGY
jgi:hypothetical protein